MTNERSSTRWGSEQQDTINAVLRRALEANPDREFLDFLGKKFSVADLDRQACRLANGLSALGVSKGQTVATLLDNSEDAVFIWLAINKLGAISVPINTAYKGEFLRHQLGDSDATVVIAESDYAERVIDISDQLPSVTTLVHRGEAPSSTFKGDTMTWEQLLSDDASDPAVEVSPSDLAMLIYTGGTTGPSKGCMVSHNYACNLARLVSEGTGRSADTVSWTALPLFHFNAVSNVICELMHGG
ncbi:MAG: AMP-binding protein, partial [Spongiibacter sp.]|nr:AMP-binding protein [Spongiibacter sp.]